MIKHHEFEFKVLAPDNIHRCFFNDCKHMGEWRVVVKDDRNNVVTEYENICEQHIIMAFIVAACGEW